MTQTGPRLVLDRQHMIAMLSDKEFYSECPHFLWLRDAALAAYKQFAASNNCCGGEFAYMQPIVTAFFKNMCELHEVDPAILETVRIYLTKRKKKPIGPILIHYRTSSKESAQFTF